MTTGQTRPGGPLIRAGRAFLQVGLPEWVVIVFLLVLGGMLAATPAERGSRPHLGIVLACLAVIVAAVVVYRGCFQGRAVARMVYRLVVVAAVAVPYALLRDMIPIIHPGDVDADLAAVDLALFGGHASIWLEQYASPFASAWFAISYLGYYLVASLFLVGMMLFCKRQEVFAEFGLMVLGTICTGLILYNVLPAQGPYVYLEDWFLAPLPEHTVVPFVHGVMRTGPLRDVFPSMHTAVPVVIFLFSARYLRWVALACGLWVPHIVLSTMFLRYHYLIDVLAGILLSVTWFALARPMLRAFQRLRLRSGVAAEP